MKNLFWSLFLFFLFAAPSAFPDSEDDAASQKALRKQQKTIESRDAMQKERDLEKDVDYEAIAQKAALLEQKKKERENYLTKEFEKVYLKEVTKARRTYALDTVSFLEGVALNRYKEDPNRRTNRYALATLYLFNCEYQTYVYNTTPTMYERPRLEKSRAETALKGVILVDKMLVDSPKDPDLWRMKGTFLSYHIDKRFSRSRHFVDAEAALKKAVELSGEEPAEAKLALARFYFNQPAKRGRNPEKAVALAQELAQNQNSFVAVEAHLIAGRAAEEKYDYEIAYEEFKAAKALEPKNPEVVYFYNMAHKDRKRFRKLMDSP